MKAEANKRGVSDNKHSRLKIIDVEGHRMGRDNFLLILRSAIFKLLQFCVLEIKHFHIRGCLNMLIKFKPNSCLIRYL